MKSKSLTDTTPAVKSFFSSSGLHEFNEKALVIIMSDSDAAFRGDNRDEDPKVPNPQFSKNTEW